ncbi:MAG: hypothetical protein LAC69_00105, partial [Chlorobium sp.]|nr:hypothetical protein [Chlorobium sp.]
NRPLAVATLSIPALKGKVCREFSIKFELCNNIFIGYELRALFLEGALRERKTQDFFSRNPHYA